MKVHAFRQYGEISALILQMINHQNYRRLLFVLPGLLILCYALMVLISVQIIPDLGIRTVFSTEIHPPYPSVNPVRELPERLFLKWIGDREIKTWGDVLKAPSS